MIICYGDEHDYAMLRLSRYLTLWITSFEAKNRTRDPKLKMALIEKCRRLGETCEGYRWIQMGEVVQSVGKDCEPLGTHRREPAERNDPERAAHLRRTHAPSSEYQYPW